MHCIFLESNHPHTGSYISAQNSPLCGGQAIAPSGILLSVLLSDGGELDFDSVKYKITPTNTNIIIIKAIIKGLFVLA